MRIASRRRAAMRDAQRWRRVRTFLSRQVLDRILTATEEELLRFEQRDIAVVFCDLRGFTAFAHTAPAAEIIDVLGAYYRAIGPVIVGFDGVLERFTGDGVMVYFDGGSPHEQARRAVRMAVRMRERVRPLRERWQRRGHDLSMGIGIALGEATLGPIGFDLRRDYAAVGPVTNLASRLCAEAGADEVLVTARLCDAAGDIVEAEALGARRLKGFARALDVYRVHGVHPPAPATSSHGGVLEYAEARG